MLGKNEEKRDRRRLKCAEVLLSFFSFSLDCLQVSVEAFGNNHRKLQKNSRVHSIYNLDFVKMLDAAKK